MPLALRHLTLYWLATHPSLAQGISSGSASWDRLFQAALEAEHSGIRWKHRVVVILQCSHISISLSCCSLNGGRRLGVWLRHASLSSAFSSSPGAWLLHGTRPCHPCVAPKVHTASFEMLCFSISQHPQDVRGLL